MSPQSFLHVAFLLITLALIAPSLQHPENTHSQFPCYLYYKLLYQKRGDVPDPYAMQIRGTFPFLDNWETPFPVNFQGDGVYTARLHVSLGSTYEFKALRSNQWKLGANDKVTISVCNATLVNTPWFEQKTGVIDKIEGVWSDFFSNNRSIATYLPPVYVENVLSHIDQVLVMHDGQNLFFPDESFGGQPWYAQKTMDELIIGGKAPNVALVGVYNSNKRMEEYTYSRDAEYGGGNGDQYLDFLETTALPRVQQEYPRLSIKLESGDWNRDGLGILGSSLGGLISCYAGWTRSKVYSRIGCMSSSFWWNNQDFRGSIVTQSMPSHPITIYVDSGNAPGQDGDGWEETLTVYKYLDSLPSLKNSVYYYLAEGGEHNEYFWSLRFSVPISNLFPL